MNKKIISIKLLALDVDGVLTDGKIIIDSRGEEIKNFDVQDGFGLVLLKRAGLKIAIITARESAPVVFRARDLKFDQVYQNARPKIKAYEEMIQSFGLKDEEVCFMGDDLPDLQVLKRVGFAVSVPNGHDEARKAADYVTKKSGGCGAVREVVELILKEQGKWDEILQAF